MALDHATTDFISSAANIAALVCIAFIGIYWPRRLARSEREQNEVAKQGDKLNRVVGEVRHLQQQCTYRTREQPSISPFDVYWDR